MFGTLKSTRPTSMFSAVFISWSYDDPPIATLAAAATAMPLLRVGRSRRAARLGE